MDTDQASPPVFEILLLLAFLIPAILFLLTQHNILKTVLVENRRMRPGLVWLQLVPFFGQIWQFFTVTRIANSIQKEIASRQDDSILGLPDPSIVEELGKRPTFAIGIAYCVLYTTGLILNLSLPVDGRNDRLIMIPGLCFLSGMTCWVIYWVQLSQYKKKLKVWRV